MDDFLELTMARHQSLTELAVTQAEDDEMDFWTCVWLLLFMLEETTLTLGFFMLALGFFILEEAREEPEEMLTFNFWMREEAREEEPEEETPVANCFTLCSSKTTQAAKRRRCKRE